MACEVWGLGRGPIRGDRVVPRRRRERGAAALALDLRRARHHAARVVLLADVGRRHDVAVERARVLDEPAAVVGVGVGAARRLRLLDEEVADRPLEADGGEGDVDVRLLRRVDGGDLGVRQQAARRQDGEEVGGDQLDRPEGERQQRRERGARGGAVEQREQQRPRAVEPRAARLQDLVRRLQDALLRLAVRAPPLQLLERREQQQVGAGGPGGGVRGASAEAGGAAASWWRIAATTSLASASAPSTRTRTALWLATGRRS